MRRIAAGSLVACATAMIIAACGGSSPITPTPPAGGGGGGTVTNTPPQIKSITVSDSRVEVGTPITLTAVVEDLETPVANLTYTWSAPTGTFSGTGAIVTWTPGADAVTPGDFVVTLTVTERYTSGTSTLENKVTGTVTAHVNNSPKELADMSLRFLGDFVNSKIPPDKCVAEFSDSCRGKQDEFADIDDNRHDYEIIASTLRSTSLTIASNRVTATVHTFCSFTSKVITTQPRDEPCQNGKCPLGSIQGPVTGDCFTTNVYQNGRWWLCESHFGPVNGIWTNFARAFFHMDRRELR
jgi:PKD domain